MESNPTQVHTQLIFNFCVLLRLIIHFPATSVAFPKI